ncbi:Transposase IS200 like protein [Phycisphaerae bacterium RAS1]|nr:Transposase IS200 like protein [Phycisphaerae bacterium RAS1]
MLDDANNLDRLATWGRSRAVRLHADAYSGVAPIHLTICAADGRPFEDAALAQTVCTAFERVAAAGELELSAYCLMPDHLHVLIRPMSGFGIDEFLRRMKSYTTRWHQRATGRPVLWQRSARDRVLRANERLATVVAYIANNPVRAGLVSAWTQWPYTRVYCEI